MLLRDRRVPRRVPRRVLISIVTMYIQIIRVSVSAASSPSSSHNLKRVVYRNDMQKRFGPCKNCISAGAFIPNAPTIKSSNQEIKYTHHSPSMNLPRCNAGREREWCVYTRRKHESINYPSLSQNNGNRQFRLIRVMLELEELKPCPGHQKVSRMGLVLPVQRPRRGSHQRGSVRSNPEESDPEVARFPSSVGQNPDEGFCLLRPRRRRRRL